MDTTITLFSKFFNNIYFVGVFTFISIFFFFSGIFLGLDFTDTFYHINLAQNPPDGIFLYPILLSSFILKGIIEIFGPHLIYLRFINACLFFIAVFIPFLFIKTGASNITKLFYIGCILFLIAPLNANVLGYDSFSIFFNSLIFTITILYFKRRKLYLLVILAILCSMTILIRLPNAIVLPIVAFVIFYKEKLVPSKFDLSYIKIPLFFLFLSLLGVFLIYYFYYKDFEIFKNASLGTISHDFKTLFYRYFRDGIKLIIFFFFIIGTYLLFRKNLQNGPKYLAFGLNSFLYILFIVFFLFSGYSYTIFLTALILSMMVIHFYSDAGKNKPSDSLILILFFAFLFINAFGSNLGLLKTSFLFLLLPFVLCVVPVVSINFWKSIFIIFVPFALFGKLYRTYEDGNILKLNKTLDFELLYPIKTSKERYVFLNEVDQKVKELQKENVTIFFYGNKSHIFHYLYPNTTLDIKAFTQPVENLVFLPHIEAKVGDKTKGAVFLMHSYPESGENPENLLETELINEGFEKIKVGEVEFLVKYED